MIALRKVPVVLGSVACVAIAVPALAGVGSTQALSGARSAVHTTSSRSAGVSIYPMTHVLARMSTSSPPTIKQCEKAISLRCYGAHEIETAYNLAPLYKKGIKGQGETIAIVDAFGSPTAKHDLGVFDKTYHLAAPPSFKIIRPAGKFHWKANSTDEGWAGETTLDIEYAHTIAPKAKLLLVETPKAENEGRTGFPQIVKAENYVVNHHLADVITQSFGATENSFATAQSLLSLRSAYLNAARHGVTVLASSGDDGATDSKYNVNQTYTHRVTSWPDSDPLVTGIGGTELSLNNKGKRTAPDVAWNDSYDTGLLKAFGSSVPEPLATGGGKSIVFKRPSFQNKVASVVGPHRGVPDISMSGSCSGAVNTYQSFAGAKPGWYIACGTSEASPLFSGIVALAAQVAHHHLGVINPALYKLSAEHAKGLVDVTSGNNTVTFTQNKKQYTVKGFDTRKGYDLVTGVGTVDAAQFVPELARAS